MSRTGASNVKKKTDLTIPERSGPATMEDMEVLQWKLLQFFLWYMDDANVPPGERTAAHLNCVRQFLRDNHCMVNAAHRVPLRKGLNEMLTGFALPFPSTKQ
jgi:hypothetical protein